MSSSPDLIQETWLRYAAFMMPGWTEKQMAPMRGAFFSGAQALIDMIDNAKNPDEWSRVMDDVHAEIMRYALECAGSAGAKQ